MLLLAYKTENYGQFKINHDSETIKLLNEADKYFDDQINLIIKSS